jgi:hypothetical protein
MKKLLIKSLTLIFIFASASLSGQIQLKNPVRILDAARESARTGKRVDFH